MISAAISDSLHAAVVDKFRVIIVCCGLLCSTMLVQVLQLLVVITFLTPIWL